MNHATASNTSLHRMLERLMDMVMEKQPRSVEERKGLLDTLAEQLVNTGLFSLSLSGSKVTRKKIIFNAYQVRVGQCVRGNSIKLQRSNPLLKDEEALGWNSRASNRLEKDPHQRYDLLLPTFWSWRPRLLRRLGFDRRSANCLLK